MAWTGRYTHGNTTDTTYAKPDTLSATPSWGADVIAEAKTASYQYQRTYADIPDGTNVIIFLRSGVSPAATDTALAEVSNDAKQAALDAGKIPRPAAAIAAGAASTESWAIVTDGTENMVITKVIS